MRKEPENDVWGGKDSYEPGWLLTPRRVRDGRLVGAREQRNHQDSEGTERVRNGAVYSARELQGPVMSSEETQKEIR